MMTVRTTSIDMARRNSHQANVSIEQAADEIEPANDAERDLAYRQVRRIIDNDLSPNQRLIIDMREVQEMEFDEIANRMNMTAANVRVELSRARKRVREIYQARRKEMNS